MRQTIHDINMWYIDTCTIVIGIFYIGWNVVLVDGRHYLEPQKMLFHNHMGTCDFTPHPNLDEDGGTTVTHSLSWCFYVKTCFLWMKETKNPQHPDCGRMIPVTHGV